MKHSVSFFACAGLALALACSAPKPTIAEEAAQRERWISAKDLMRHVEYLASDELQGRAADAPSGLEAAAYVAERFTDFGMESFGPGYLLPLEEDTLSPNVVGFVRGRGPGFYLVCAHYDHLGVRGDGEDNVFNGADDNASGTAAVIELARAFSACAAELETSVVFAAFSAEELGLRGSRHFVANPPFPLEELRGVVNLDMIGRGEEDLVFCEGADQAPELEAAIQAANAELGLRIRWGEHPEWIPSSDHYPFMRSGIPTLYFGVEDHADYHKATDHADKLLPGLLQSVTRLVFVAVFELAAAQPG